MTIIKIEFDAIKKKKLQEAQKASEVNCNN